MYSNDIIYKNERIIKERKISTCFIEMMPDRGQVRSVKDLSVTRDENSIADNILGDCSFLQIRYDDACLQIPLYKIIENKKIIVCREFSADSNVIVDTFEYGGKIYYLYINATGTLVITDRLEKIFNISLQSRLLKIFVLGNNMYLFFIAYLYIKNNGRNRISDLSFMIGEKHICDLKIQKSNAPWSRFKKVIKFFSILKMVKIPLKEITHSDSLEINNGVTVYCKINDVSLWLPVKMKKKFKNSRYNYLPIKYVTKDNYLIFFRLSNMQNLVMVKRLLEDVEKTTKFKIYESFIFRKLFAVLALIFKMTSGKKINVYYEKFAQKAEEGTFDLFELIRDNNKTSLDYFILEDNEYYEQLCDRKNVVKKYSFKYYVVVMAAHNLISTESPTHIHLIRNRNRTLKKSIYNKKFVFLQHGVTYLKAHGKNSPYLVGKEAEPDVMVVNSKKEKNIVRKMLLLPARRIYVAGMPIFDKIDYNHINAESEDIVTIMLTWKPYEEHMENFELSSYYKYTMNIYNMLLKYVDRKNIVIIPHPKVREQFEKTCLKESLDDRKISEILGITKLLITDYSSVCYNSYYQGGGVVFYQEDIVRYEEENGRLIPEDDEYIGYRCFKEEEFEKHLKSGINAGEIDLDYFRTSYFSENYLAINEFNDGRNIERIFNMLVESKII